MMAKKQITAVAYVRVSHEKQVYNYSLDTQTEIIRRYAEANGIQLAACFREEGYSGRNTNRPQYRSMMQYIAENKPDMVIVHRLDRLHREEYNALTDIRYFRQNGIKFITIAEGIDSDDEMSTLSITIHAILAANYSRNLAKETRKGLIAGAKCCKHMGGKPPYGFKVNPDNGMLEIDETTAPAIRTIFQLYAEGFTTGEICEWLESHGYRTSNGNSFKANSLNSILHNEKYRGCYVWDKSVPKDSEGHRNSHKYKSDYIKIEGGCPEIVSQELFEKAQERLKYNSCKANRNKAKRYYPLNGRIYCQCGARMTGNVQYSKNRKYYQYRCTAECGNKPIRAEHLERLVLISLRECLFSSANSEQILSTVNLALADQQKDMDSLYQQLNSKKSGLVTAQENLFKAVETGKATSAVMKRLERVSNELESITSRIENFDKNPQSLEENDLLPLKEDFASYMQNNGTVNAKRLLDSLIQKVQVNTDTVDLQLKNPISIDSKVKKIFKGEPIMNTKIKKLSAILLNVTKGADDIVVLHLAVCSPGLCSYTGTCQLAITYNDLINIAEEADCDVHSLVGSCMELEVQMRNDNVENILKISKSW